VNKEPPPLGTIKYQN